MLKIWILETIRGPAQTENYSVIFCLCLKSLFIQNQREELKMEGKDIWIVKTELTICNLLRSGTLFTKITTSSYNTSWQIEGENVDAVTDFLFGDSIITEGGDCSYEIKKHLLLGRKPMKNIGNILKIRDITSSTSQTYAFSSSHVWMWELVHKEDWGLKNWCFRTVVLKNWCFRTVVLEKMLKSPPDFKEIKPVNQPWMLIGRTDAEAPILWPPDLKSRLIAKAPDAGKDWRQKEKGEAEDEMVR